MRFLKLGPRKGRSSRCRLDRSSGFCCRGSVVQIFSDLLTTKY
jgi:hypothetical protein